MAPPEPPLRPARPDHLVRHQSDERLQLAAVKSLDRRLQLVNVSLIHLVIILPTRPPFNRPGSGTYIALDITGPVLAAVDGEGVSHLIVVQDQDCRYVFDV